MATTVYNCISRIADVIIENKEFLTDLDREIGDADHGVNLARGYKAVLEKIPQEEAELGTVLKKTGMTLLSTVGGASGPLYGTAYMEAGKVMAGKEKLSPEDFLNVLDAAIAGIIKRGKAVQGEKTMLDSLIPARNAYAEKMESDPCAALDDACKAAAEGVEYTKTIRATKGRASYLGDRSIGHQDPGATSALLTLEVLRDALKEVWA